LRLAPMIQANMAVLQFDGQRLFPTRNWVNPLIQK
jgi:hypothetical protein